MAERVVTRESGSLLSSLKAPPMSRGCMHAHLALGCQSLDIALEVPPGAAPAVYEHNHRMPRAACCLIRQLHAVVGAELVCAARHFLLQVRMLLLYTSGLPLLLSVAESLLQYM